MSLLAAESLDLGDGHPFDLKFAESVFNFLQFKRFMMASIFS